MTIERNRFTSFDFRGDPRIQPAMPSRQNSHAAESPNGAGTAANKTRGGWWPFPGLIFVLLATNISIVSITALYAVSDTSFAIEPDYYKQAVNWDQTVAQRERNRDLGWAAVMPTSISSQPVVLRLHDRAGQPVSGARVEMIAFHNAHSGNRLSTSLVEIDPGMYRSTESLVRSGSWEVRISATRAGETFTAVLAHIVQAKETEK